MTFLPTTYQEMIEQGIEVPDFVYVTGDAYVDHPSFGAAIITRILENRGYKVCVLAEPDYQSNKDFKRFGKPRLGFLISGGNIDSMVNNYSVAKIRRKRDVYSHDGLNHRPDRALIVYSKLARSAYPDTDIIIGGIEASLRRLAHYDYWDDDLRKSVLLDSEADLLMYGMGDISIVEIAEALDSGLRAKDLVYLDGTVYKTNDISFLNDDCIILPSYEELKRDKKKYAESFKIQYENTDHYSAKTLVEKYDDFYVVQNRPNRPLTQMELDDTYELPYERDYHFSYKQKGEHVASIDEVKFSLASNRGCFGGCSFCALTFHQGRIIQSRSKESLVNEAKKLIAMDDFKGYIHDVGGPTANFYHKACDKQEKYGVCTNRQCLSPRCPNLKVSHTDYLDILRAIRSLDGIKKVFVRSGIRYDYLIYDEDDTFFEELVQYHISGQLKVAPEHISNEVLDVMGKPRREVYEKFKKKYEEINKKYHKDQYLVPYLMSSHPGSDIHSAIALAEYLRDIHYQPQQVQDFYPTPSTISTVIYYTGIHPLTGKEVFVEKSPHGKAIQRALMQYKNPKNYSLVYEALKKANRLDLVGYGPKCLIRPRRINK